MRKLLSFHITSVDGYYEGPSQAFDWPVVDAEFNEFALRQLDEADTLLFGRATYGLMAGYWPTSVMVSPVVLGDGRSLFRTATKRISLTLLQTRSFRSGNVLLCYRPTAR